MRTWKPTFRGGDGSIRQEAVSETVEWLISRFEQLDVGEEHARDRAELYDALRLPLRWHLKNLKLARTRNWNRPRQFYYHSEPLIARSQVSLADELAQLVPRRNRKKPSRWEGHDFKSCRQNRLLDFGFSC